VTAQILGVGAGPLMLLRAIRLLEAGAGVTLFDRAAAPGGAWGVRDLLGWRNVEFGAHLLERRPALYALIEGPLGVPMEPDACFTLLGRRRVSMRWARAGFHAAAGGRALLRGEADKAVRLWRTAARTARAGGGPYAYPAGGAAALVSALAARFRASGGEIRFGAQVERLDATSDGVTLRGDFGQACGSGALISSRAFAPVVVCGRSLRLDVETGVCRNLVLHLQDDEAPPLAYVEILGHPRLKRLRELTGLVRPAPVRPDRLICIQHRGPLEGGADAGARRLLQDLAALGLLSGRARLVAAVRTDVPLATLTDATLARIERASGGRIEALPSTDLADGFVDRAGRLSLARA
jgi:hypothetical protein